MNPREPDSGAPPRESKPTVGLILLTALWAWTVLIDGPDLVSLSFRGERVMATVVVCKNGKPDELCLTRGEAAQQTPIRSSIFSPYRVGQSVPARLFSGRFETMRPESQLIRSTVMRLLTGFVLIVLWLRMWAKSKGPIAHPPAPR